MPGVDLAAEHRRDDRQGAAIGNRDDVDAGEIGKPDRRQMRAGADARMADGQRVLLLLGERNEALQVADWRLRIDDEHLRHVADQ